jgi:hypothetical protein
MGVIAGFHPVRDKLLVKNGHDSQYDWGNCPKCGKLVDTILLAASEGRPPDSCNVCIWTCGHSVRREKRKCRAHGHVWTYMRIYS